MDIELGGRRDGTRRARRFKIVLFSGDAIFRSLVEAVQRRGVRVTVVSTILSQPPMIADELRRQADVFTDPGGAANPSSAAIHPSVRPRASRVITRRSSCSARPPWRREAMTTISTI